MTVTAVEEPTSTGRRRFRVPQGIERYIPVTATVLLLCAMYTGGVVRYDNFDRPQVVANLFINNAHLLVIAVGVTFVILSGGIDLSVGSMMAFTSMLCAVLTVHAGLPAWLVVPFALLLGVASGATMGAIIHYFNIQPFIVTLAGLFLFRGLTQQLSNRDISLREVSFFNFGANRHELTDIVPGLGGMLNGGFALTNSVLIALAVVVLAFFTLHYTRLGRNVYAIGGNQQSALLMGLPVARTRVGVYAISGGCAALGGILFAFNTKSSAPLHGVALELDAIAAVVIGGTLLTGGFGFVLGTVAGVLVLGLIQAIITFQGDLSPWWARMVIGVLLLVFILLQRLTSLRRRGG